MTKEINLPDFYVSAKFEDGRVDSGRILLKQRGEYVPYARERTCHIIEDGYVDDPAVCSYCGTHYDGGRYCKYCGAKVVER